MRANSKSRGHIIIMSNEREDIRFLIRLYHELSHPLEALEQVELLCEYYPNLTIDDLSLLNAVAKEAIDPLRHTIKTLESFYSSQFDNRNIDKTHVLLEKKEVISEELLSICHRILSLMNDVILPNASQPEACAYSYKIMADLNRYIIDSDVQNEIEKAKKDASAAYAKSLQIYDKDVDYFSPVKLHVILNYAVFMFEHLHEKESAIEMLQTSLAKEESNIKDIPQNSDVYDQAVNLFQVMKTNLDAWTSGGL